MKSWILCMNFESLNNLSKQTKGRIYEKQSDISVFHVFLVWPQRHHKYKYILLENIISRMKHIISSVFFKQNCPAWAQDEGKIVFLSFGPKMNTKPPSQ